MEDTNINLSPLYGESETAEQAIARLRIERDRWVETASDLTRELNDLKRQAGPADQEWRCLLRRGDLIVTENTSFPAKVREVAVISEKPCIVAIRLVTDSDACSVIQVSPVEGIGTPVARHPDCPRGHLPIFVDREAEAEVLARFGVPKPEDDPETKILTPSPIAPAAEKPEDDPETYPPLDETEELLVRHGVTKRESYREIADRRAGDIAQLEADLGWARYELDRLRAMAGIESVWECHLKRGHRVRVMDPSTAVLMVVGVVTRVLRKPNDVFEVSVKCDEYGSVSMFAISPTGKQRIRWDSEPNVASQESVFELREIPKAESSAPAAGKPEDNPVAKVRLQLEKLTREGDKILDSLEYFSPNGEQYLKRYDKLVVIHNHREILKERLLRLTEDDAKTPPPVAPPGDLEQAIRRQLDCIDRGLVGTLTEMESLTERCGDRGSNPYSIFCSLIHFRKDLTELLQSVRFPTV